MNNLYNNIFQKNLSVRTIDISVLSDITNQLPSSGIVDLNIAERCLILTLEAQNFCQEKIVQLDRLIGLLESEKNKSWSNAALKKAKEDGYKTAKDKEWFAQADEDYINAYNELVLAKATKKWFESKASYFSGWHYALKTFLKRDYTIENSSNIGYNSVDAASGSLPSRSEEDVVTSDDDIPWE
jgi:hypothetical protein